VGEWGMAQNGWSARFGWLTSAGPRQKVQKAQPRGSDQPTEAVRNARVVK